MKANLIENLIVAHCNGDEGKFEGAVDVLAEDEEKKGNVPLAQRIRNAYRTKKVSHKRDVEPYFDTMSVSRQPVQGTAPRDKDSLLELYEIVESTVKLSDVVLSGNQRQIIEQVISEQKNADQLYKHNVAPSNRLLLCGPPGCGKTMTAYAVGKELSMKIAYVRLDGLISSYLGQTGTNLRKVFDSVRNQRIILFLDEFDAIAKRRDDSNELGELKRVVTTLLQNFDNMPGNVFLIAATNHEHLLDPAIWRRFNVTVTLDLPNYEQRLVFFEKWFAEHEVLDLKLDHALLAKISEGLNGAQIKELTNAAVKKHLIDKRLKTEDVATILLQQLTKFSSDSEQTMQIIANMIDRGVSARQIAKAIGTPHTTLDYQLRKFRGKFQSDEQ